MSIDITQRIGETGVIAIIRGTDPEAAIEVVEALRRGGVSVVEVTANTDGVLEMIRDISSSFTPSEVTIGAGTVLDTETAQAVINAGSEFIVSPSFDAETVQTANRYSTPSVIGVTTPTEAVNAYASGADMVKVFPASSVGPDFVSSLQGPLGHIPTVPTGGITLDNVGGFIQAGATAVGVGSSLVDNEAIERRDYEALTANAREFIEAVDAVSED